ncbi:MAG: DUF1656 domain-containing protein [Chthoniobacteraceae bacterium]
MISEFDFFGVLLPALLVYSAVAFGLKEGVCRVLARLGAYRFIWHRALFDSALFLVLLGAVVLFSHCLFP